MQIIFLFISMFWEKREHGFINCITDLKISYLSKSEYFCFFHEIEYEALHILIIFVRRINILHKFVLISFVTELIITYIIWKTLKQDSC